MESTAKYRVLDIFMDILQVTLKKKIRGTTFLLFNMTNSDQTKKNDDSNESEMKMTFKDKIILNLN